MADAHILVVDDDRDTRELYRLVFESNGYRVSEAGSVAEGLELTTRLHPTVLLTDWRLADGTAFALCDALHRAGDTRQMPIVAATGLSLSPEEVRRVRRLGCEDVLTKPVDIDRLVERVNRAVAIRTSRRLRAATRRAERFAARLRRAGDDSDMAARIVAHATRSARPDVALIVADDGGRYVAANASAASLTGYDPQELTNLSVWDLTPSPSADDARRMWASFIRAGCQEGEYLVRQRDGHAVPARYVAIANVAPGLHLSALIQAVSSRRPVVQ